MKNRTYLLTLITGVLLLNGCSTPEVAETYEQGAMRFTFTHPGSLTRATTTGFETGDKIGLYVVKVIDSLAAPLQLSGNHANNEPVTFNGTLWEPRKPIYWPEERVDVYAYYPYMEISTVDAQPFAVQTDQSSPETAEALSGYEASDLLWAKAESLTAAETAVPLQFSHRMSKLVIRLVKGADYEGELPESARLYIHNTIPTAQVDLATGAVMKDPYGKPATIQCRQVSAGEFEAIIVPQRIETRRPLIEIVANDIAYLLEDNFNFKSGMQHTLNLVINASPEQIKIEIDPSTGEWN